MIILHVILLTGSVLFAVGCIFVCFGTFPRPVTSIINAIVPMIVVGILCALVLSVNGQPRVEWIVPTLAIFAVGLFCRSERIFKIVRWGMLILSVTLCVNFLNIVQTQGYTASPNHAHTVASLHQKIVIHEVAAKLRKDHSPSDVLPQGQVGIVDQVEITPEWHTPLTRLHKIVHKEAIIWYPGGPVLESIDDLVIQHQ